MAKRIIGAVAVVAVLGGGWVYAQRSKGPVSLTADDYNEIRNVHARFGHALDFGDTEEMAAIFTEDGEIWDNRGKQHAKGRAELMKLAAPRKERGATHHWYTNVVIVPTNEGVTVKAYYMGVNAASDLKKIQGAIMDTGQYVDDLVKTPQGWKFKVHRAHHDTFTPGTAPSSSTGQ